MGVTAKLKLAVFISGRGSNMVAINEACKAAGFPAEISVILSNNPNAGGLAYAKEHGIATEVVNHKDFDSRETFEAQILQRLESHDFDLIVLAGFMRILTASFVENFPKNSMINIHPSLLPDYKGLNTHARAIADGQKEGGCSVHYVIPDLDSGQVILQKRVPILEGDTAESLEKRVLEQEHHAYSEAIRMIAASKGVQ